MLNDGDVETDASFGVVLATPGGGATPGALSRCAATGARPVAWTGAIWRKLGGMRVPEHLRRSRRAPPRHWLLLCAVAILGQIAAPALAWCLHDDTGAHVESALNDCDHADPQHQMVDAQQPGAAVAQGGDPVTMPVAAIFSRLLPADWLEAGSIVYRSADRVGGARPPPLIEYLAGHTTRLLI